MNRVERQALLPYSADQMYRLVADIEAYPDYINACRKARILSSDGDSLVAELVLGKAGLEQTFSTRNSNRPGSQIDMVLERGPFRSLQGRWLFSAIDESSCRVSFSLQFEMRRPLLQRIIAALVAESANSLVDAICQRADEIYGPGRRTDGAND